MLYPSTIELADNNLKNANMTSRNDFIDFSIKHYVGYLHKDDNSDYLNKVIDETLFNRLKLIEEQLSTVLFKLSVEINTLAQIIAATTDIGTETLNQIKLKSTNEVKRTVGKIDLEEIFKSYIMKEGD